MKTTPDHATAYHEAGHAVVALALGRRVEQITIVGDHKFAGLCEFGKGAKPSDDWLEREMLIALGGIAAEARHTGNYAWDAAHHDCLFVRKMAEERAGASRADRLERRMLSKVEHLLAEEGHWRAVELIAAELLKTRVISGRTAKHLFERGCKEC